MELIIDLQDLEGKSHSRKALTFKADATVKELEKRIKDVFHIEPDHQRLFFGDEQLLLGTLQDSGITNGGTVVVKHDALGHWKFYTSKVPLVKEANRKNKEHPAKEAMKFYTLLEESNFFLAYPKFGVEAITLHKTISNALDKLTTSIEEAASNYFKRMFQVEYQDITFKPADDGGTRSAVMCDIAVGSVTHTYRVKTNHGAGTGDRDGRSIHIDLRELFCYKLFELIEVGATVELIPTCVSSKAVIYIGSKWLPNFRPLRESRPPNKTADQIRRALVQIHLLATHLSLGDMHGDNFGTDESSNPKIVDFMISNYSDPKEKFLNVKLSVFHTYPRVYEIDLLSNCEASDRLLIAKESIEEWDFVTKLDETLKWINENVIGQLFAGQSLNFKQTSDEFCKYVETVKTNIENLSKLDIGDLVK